MPAAYNKFNAFTEDVCEKKHDLGADTLKLLLTLTAPVATNSVKADLTEIAPGNGYSAGGNTITVTTSAQASGTYTLAANQVVFTASGGPFANLRYVVFYNSTPAAGPLIAWWDYGVTLTLNDGETLTVKFNSASPGTIFTLV